MYNIKEFDILASGLVERKIPFSFHNSLDGYQIVVDSGDIQFDVVCNLMSMGHDDSLLEGRGNIFDDVVESGDVVGYLKAYEVLNYLDRKVDE